MIEKIVTTLAVSVACMTGGCGGPSGPSGPSGSSVCIPGATTSCTCTDGRAGAQSCDSEGTFSACSCAGQPADGKKRVFVTSTAYSGNLRGTTGQASGTAAGDSLCDTAAKAAGLGGTWKVFLSDSTTNAVDRIADVGPWYLLDGRKAFNNKANLATTALTPINLDEQLRRVSSWDGRSSHAVWTGTQTGGIRATNTCSDWSATSGNGAVGGVEDVANWSGSCASCGLSCYGGGAYRMHLYCFEQ